MFQTFSFESGNNAAEAGPRVGKRSPSKKRLIMWIPSRASSSASPLTKRWTRLTGKGHLDWGGPDQGICSSSTGGLPVRSEEV